MAFGTLGNVRSLNGGLFEAKIEYGPGFRLYFVNSGNKRTQQADITNARNMVKEI